MWPFAKRGSRVAVVAPEPRDLPVFSEFERNDVDVKVWLPQGLTERLDWISQREDVSRPAVIRALLFEHLYGRVAYMALRARCAQQQAEKVLSEARNQAREAVAVDDGGTRFSRERHSGIEAELIGKPTDNLRLELPRRMKRDLKVVAGLSRLTPSSYVRKMLVLQLQGECAHAAWQTAIGQIGPDVVKLERDD